MKTVKKFIFFSLVLIFEMIVLLGGYGCNVNKRSTRISNELDKYNKHQSGLYLAPDYKDALIVFPNEITDKMQVNAYYVLEVTQAFKNVGYNMVLDVSYSNDEYMLELHRLEEWERQYNYESHQGTAGLLYDDENFIYPAFVAAYNSFLAYEYALVLPEYRIIYVYISRIHRNETKLLDEHLPKNYFDINMSTDGYVYSVYYNKQMWMQDNLHK